MTEKHGSPIETLGDDRKERGRGFEESRVQVEKGRGLEGWKRQRAGGLEGWRYSQKQKEKDSRIQGVKWRKAEGWRVR